MFGCAFGVAMAAGARTPVVVVAPSVMAGDVTVGGAGGEWSATDALCPPDVTLSQPSATTAPPPAIAAIARILTFFSAAIVLSPSFLGWWILLPAA